MEQLAPARPVQRFNDIGLVLLQLECSLATPKQLNSAATMPFVGGPGYRVEFVTTTVITSVTATVDTT